MAGYGIIQSDKTIYLKQIWNPVIGQSMRGIVFRLT